MTLPETPDEPRDSDVDAILRLHRRELELTVQDAEKPYWKRPGFWTALIPSLLGAGALLTGFVTGYIQNEWKLLELRKREVSQKVDALAVEFETLQTQKENLEIEVSVLKRKLELGEIGVHLESILHPTGDLSPYDDSMEALIRLLGSEGRDLAQKEILSQIAIAKDAKTRAFLHYALYRGLESDEHRDKLLEILRSEGPDLIGVRSGDGFWSIFQLLRWDSADQIKLVEHLVPVLELEGFNEFTRNQLLGSIGSLMAGSDGSIRFSDAGMRDRIVRLARNQLLNHDLPWHSRSGAIRPVALLAPEAAVLIGAFVLMSEEHDLNLRTGVFDELAGERSMVLPEMLRLGAPRKINAEDWKEWLETPAARELRAKWIDDHP